MDAKDPVRESFESWYYPDGKYARDDLYQHGRMHSVWLGYQAGASALSAQAAEVERLRGALINCYDDLYSLAYVHNKAFETAEGLRDFAESSYKRAKEAASLPPAAPEPTPSKEVPHAD